MGKYKPAIFQPTIRPSWGGALSYIPTEEKAKILEAIINYPRVHDIISKFWEETIKPDLDNQYDSFLATCQARGKGAKTYWETKNKDKDNLSLPYDEDKDNLSLPCVNHKVNSLKDKDKDKDKDKSKNEKNYAFEGKVIKLSPKDFDRWKKAYPDLNLYGELMQRDEWLSSQPPNIQKQWFLSTSQFFIKQNSFRKEQNTALAEKVSGESYTDKQTQHNLDWI